MSEEKKELKREEREMDSTGSWSNVPDWCYIILGIALVIIGFAMQDAETWSAVILGIIMICVGFWDLYTPNIAAVWAEGVVAFIVFLLPWFGDLYQNAAQWWTWAVGILGMICAAWSWASHSDAD